MTTFAIMAATVSGNRGAEAMLETSIGRLRDRFPDAVFEVFSYYPDRDAALVTAPDVRVRSATPATLVLVHLPWSLLLGLLRVLRLPYHWGPSGVRALASSDALIDLAGVSFIDGREKFLPFNVLTILPAMVLGVPVFKLAQAVGPFAHPANRFAARILRRCRLLVARGDVTVANLASIDYPADRTIAAPDVAFLFEPRDALSDEGAAEAERLTATVRTWTDAGVESVGICPSAVLAAKAERDGWDYVGFVAAIADGVLASGRGVLLFPNATRAGSTKLRNNDLPVIAAVAARLGRSGAGRVAAVTGDVSAAALRTLVSACSCVAVSRFHAMVGALAAGVPVAVIGWSHKYLEVMRQFGQDRYVFDAADRDAGRFLGRLLELCERREEAAAEVRAALPTVAAAAAVQFDEVAARLAGVAR